MNLWESYEILKMLKLWIYDRVMKCYIAVANQQYVISSNNCPEARKMWELWKYDELWCMIILSS